MPGSLFKIPVSGEHTAALKTKTRDEWLCLILNERDDAGTKAAKLRRTTFIFVSFISSWIAFYLVFFYILYILSIFLFNILAHIKAWLIYVSVVSHIITKSALCIIHRRPYVQFVDLKRKSLITGSIYRYGEFTRLKSYDKPKQ